MKQWLRITTLVMAVLVTGCSNNAYTNNPQGYYSDAELDQMLAPIALYPDMVLSQVLMAATYQPELEDAAYWSRRNPGLRGSAAVNAVDRRDWDPSVKAMVAFPELLAEMAGNPDWTWRLGDAYLSQEADVAAAIQRLRQRAYRGGHLNRLDHMRVYDDGGYLIIEPYDPGVVYLPYYQPLTVYGSWWWPSHPPHYWGAPRGYSSGLTFYWGTGITVGTGFFYSGFHWPSRHIVVYDRRDYRPYRGQGYYKHYYNPRPWHYQAQRYPDRHRYDYRRDHNRYKDGYPRSPGGFRGDWERKSYPQDHRTPDYRNPRNQDWERQRGGDYRNDGRRDDYRRDDYRRDGYRRDGSRSDGNSNGERWRNGDQERNGSWQRRQDVQQPSGGEGRPAPGYRPQSQPQPDGAQQEQQRPRRSEEWQRRSEERGSDFRTRQDEGGFTPGARENHWQQQQNQRRGGGDDQWRRPGSDRGTPAGFPPQQRASEAPAPNPRPQEAPPQMRPEQQPQRFEAPAVQRTEFPDRREAQQERPFDQPRPEPQRNPRTWERNSGGDGGRHGGERGGFGGERGGFGGGERGGFGGDRGGVGGRDFSRE